MSTKPPKLPRPVVNGCDFQLWDDVPDGWLRAYGRTRVLVIDDQWTGRELFFGAASPKAPLTPEEELLQRWLNTEVVFFPMPTDYSNTTGDTVPQGTFDEAWFQAGMQSVLTDPRPVAAVLLDLMFGDETTIRDASGPKFLTLLREHMPDVPVLVLSNLEGTLEVRGASKKGGQAGTGDVSFQDYLPKKQAGGDGILERLWKKLLLWADLSDPALSAFSPPMRRLAKQMRRILLEPEEVSYQENNAKYPRPVVITGPVGSGKNYVAKCLRDMSARRNSPYRVIEFSGHEERDFTTSLFGVGVHSESTTFLRVRRSDGAVLAVNNDRKRLGDGPNDVVLSQTGILHEAHIAAQPPGQNQQPLRGTVLIDEIGTAPPAMQTRLLGVFNRGRFTPHLTSANIPEQGALDVWFLVTLSPEGQELLRDDLRRRLDQGRRLDVPPLRKRAEDILPLVMKQMTSQYATEEPENIFTADAIRMLRETQMHSQVGMLISLVTRIPDTTGVTPYSADDIRRTIAAGLEPAAGESRPTALDDTIPKPDVGSSDAPPSVEPLELLRAWLQAGQVSFPSDIRLWNALRGAGKDVRGGAATAILSFLELCVVRTLDDKGHYSESGAWNYFAGVQRTSSNDANKYIARLLLLDDDVTLERLRHSDGLLWLALSAAYGRRKGVGEIIKRLEQEPGHSERVRQLRVKLKSRKPSKRG